MSDKSIHISTKKSKLKKGSNKYPPLKKWITKDGIRSSLIDWYLKDFESRRWLEKYCDYLGQEYISDLDGNICIKWNHLQALLDNYGMSDSIKEQFFRTFLYTGKRTIKKISFKWQKDQLVPVSLGV